MIKILEDLGVPDAFFFKYQNRALDRLRLVTADPARTVKFLHRQKIAAHMGLAGMMGWLLRNGIDYRHDRFLCSVVEASVIRELRLLKHKSRIPLDEGVTLFGICDETGFLSEGQVFVTFDAGDGLRTRYTGLDGKAMYITRYPPSPSSLYLVKTLTNSFGKGLRQCTQATSK